MSPGNELDRRIALEVMKWLPGSRPETVITYSGTSDGWAMKSEIRVPDFSSNIAASFEMEEKRRGSFLADSV